MRFESISEPDDMDMDETQNGTDKPFFDIHIQDDRHSSLTSPETSVKGGKKSSDGSHLAPLSGQLLV